MAKKTVLVTGGSGYLGQFVVQDLAKIAKVAYTHHTSAAPEPHPRAAGDHPQAIWVDLATGVGLQEAFDALGPLDVVINCAAVSAPAACEKNHDAARAINVPAKLLDALDRYKSTFGQEPLLIHISTDQVYDGTKSWWSEDDGCNPVNSYGKTKREAEVVIQDRWPNHVILRSSIIYGPQCPTPVSRMLFLQFIEGSLQSGKPTSFFEDEFRCPIYVCDIIAIIRAIIERNGALPHRLFNMGGPERLSRVDMANKVAEVHAYSKASIISAPSSSINRGVASPADISMVVTRLMRDLQVPLTPFGEALMQMKLATEER